MLAGIVFVLRHGKTVFTVLGSIVLAVEALANAVGAKGEDKRELAIDKARAEFVELGVELPDGLLRTLVNVTVWLMNGLTGKGWSIEAKEAAEEIEATAVEAESPAARRTLGDLEAQARAEFAAVAKRREARAAGEAP